MDIAANLIGQGMSIVIMAHNTTDDERKMATLLAYETSPGSYTYEELSSSGLSFQISGNDIEVRWDAFGTDAIVYLWCEVDMAFSG